MGAIVIFERHLSAGDERIIEFRESDGVVELTERTVGPGTEMVFDDYVHTNVLRMNKNAQHVLLGVLGGEDMVSALRQLFAAEEGVWLSDVQDVLDRAGVPYGYASYGSDSLVFRPPFFG